jgi:integral membrane protein
MSKSPIGTLRAVGLAEGISYVLLLGVAMPLKYLAGMPLAVRIVGMIHGILFIVFCGVLYRVFTEIGWSKTKTAGVFVASLVPFGTIAIDPMLRREDERRAAGQPVAPVVPVADE